MKDINIIHKDPPYASIKTHTVSNKTRPLIFLTMVKDGGYIDTDSHTRIYKFPTKIQK